MKSLSPEYRNYIQSPQWKAKSKSYRERCNCCLFPWLKPREAHHMTYENLKRECFWRDVLPLSKTAHWIVGWGILWKKGHPEYLPRRIVNFYLRFIGFPIAFLARMIFG